MVKIEEERTVLNNYKINKDEGCVVVSLNPGIYSIEVIFSAAHSFTDKNYILIEGDKDIEVLVEIKPKKMLEIGELDKLGREFGNRVIAYQDYKHRSDESKEVRQILLQRALLTNSPEVDQENKEPVKKVEEAKVPWEEDFLEDERE